MAGALFALSMFFSARLIGEGNLSFGLSAPTPLPRVDWEPPAELVNTPVTIPAQPPELDLGIRGILEPLPADELLASGFGLSVAGLAPAIRAPIGAFGSPGVEVSGGRDIWIPPGAYSRQALFYTDPPGPPHRWVPPELIHRDHRGGSWPRPEPPPFEPVVPEPGALLLPAALALLLVRRR